MKPETLKKYLGKRVGILYNAEIRERVMRGTLAWMKDPFFNTYGFVLLMKGDEMARINPWNVVEIAILGRKKK